MGACSAVQQYCLIQIYISMYLPRQRLIRAGDAVDASVRPFSHNPLLSRGLWFSSLNHASFGGSCYSSRGTCCECLSLASRRDLRHRARRCRGLVRRRRSPCISVFGSVEPLSAGRRQDGPGVAIIRSYVGKLLLRRRCLHPPNRTSD